MYVFVRIGHLVTRPSHRLVREDNMHANIAKTAILRGWGLGRPVGVDQTSGPAANNHLRRLNGRTQLGFLGLGNPKLTFEGLEY